MSDGGLTFPKEWKPGKPRLEEIESSDPPAPVDPYDAALHLLGFVQAQQQEAVESGGHVAMPAPTDVANIYARAQVYATLALCERMDGLILVLRERER